MSTRQTEKRIIKTKVNAYNMATELIEQRLEQEQIRSIHVDPRGYVTIHLINGERIHFHIITHDEWVNHTD